MLSIIVVSSADAVLYLDFRYLSFPIKNFIPMQLSSNNLLKICLGISAIILAAAAFNFSLQSANAAPPTPKEFAEEGTSKIGKYQMSMAAINHADQTLWAVIVYDTETGQSRTYYDKSSIVFGPSFNISTTSPAGN